MRYVPYHLLGDRPNIVVDGSASPSTALTLSHWPATPTPVRLARDLSAQIALDHVAARRTLPGVDAVSNDHLDQDGLVSLFALVEPDLALEHRRFLEDVASAGDFAVFVGRDAARVSFALAALADPGRSTLPAACFPDDHWERSAALYSELLGLLPALVRHPGRHGALWGEEDAAFEASERLFERGQARIGEEPGLDLAVVWVPEAAPGLHVSRFTSASLAPVHPASVRNRTGCLRLLVVQGRRYELTYRYESWVRYVSRRPLPRVDLAPLAERLQALEPAGARWRFDGVGALEPVLGLTRGDESGLELPAVRSMLVAHLRHAPPAWDPYREAGSLVV